jgi:hypothetical protein
MQGIDAALAAYDRWLGSQCQTLPAGLARKRQRMAETPFAFLRATCFRFAAQFPVLFPDLAALPPVASCGDAHMENFGTWRDAEGRLVWGVNDLDEAALLPWPADLVRLAASALLAREGDAPRARDIGATLLAGYAANLGAPRAFILDETHQPLREFAAPDAKARTSFWEKLDTLRGPAPPPAWQQALAAALPPGAGPPRFAPREAGLGSLGRPRFIAIADWRGGRVVREAKAVVPSAWLYAGCPGAETVDTAAMAAGPGRAPDPWFRLLPGMVLRRLAPDSRKLEAPLGKPAALLGLLGAMGGEIGNLHGAGGHGPVILAALRSLPADWLREAAKRAAAAVAEDHAALPKG